MSTDEAAKAKLEEMKAETARLQAALIQMEAESVANHTKLEAATVERIRAEVGSFGSFTASRVPYLSTTNRAILSDILTVAKCAGAGVSTVTLRGDSVTVDTSDVRALGAFLVQQVTALAAASGGTVH